MSGLALWRTGIWGSLSFLVQSGSGVGGVAWGTAKNSLLHRQRRGGRSWLTARWGRICMLTSRPLKKTHHLNSWVLVNEGWRALGHSVHLIRIHSTLPPTTQHMCLVWCTYIGIYMEIGGDILGYWDISSPPLPPSHSLLPPTPYTPSHSRVPTDIKDSIQWFKEYFFLSIHVNCYNIPKLCCVFLSGKLGALVLTIF